MTSQYTYPSGTRSPPPLYRSDGDSVPAWASGVNGQPSQPSPGENTPLLSAKPSKPRLYLAFIAIYLLICVLVGTMFAIISFQASTSWERYSWTRELQQHDNLRAQMGRERVGWQEETRRHVNDSRQMGMERTRWGHERDLWQVERERWAREQQERDMSWKHQRDLWEIERERWAEEQRQRSVHQPFWGAPRRLDRCLTYGTREYTAKLYNILTTEDWADKCSNTPIEIKGRRHTSPLRCEDHGLDEGIYGIWRVNYDEMDCQPTFEKFWRGECDHLPGHRRWESVLWNVQDDRDDGYEMCRSTPVTLPTGQYFATSKCEDRRNSGPNGWRGWFGKWDAPDPTCDN